MTDFQGSLKELILPPEAKPKPWETVRAPFGGQHRRKNVRPRHKMVVALHMAGHTDVEIARLLGYKPGSIALILKSDHPELLATREQAQESIAKNTGNMILRFHQEASKSVDTLIEVRDSKAAPFSERRLSALAILDRAGYSPVKKQMTMDIQVPVNELRTVVNQLDAANEVFIRKDEWAVKSLPTGDK